jgi:hypothetical protein
MLGDWSRVPARRWITRRPVLVDRCWSGAPGDRAQRERNDERVVGVAEDRDEVGHQVDGAGQVDDQQAEAETHAAGQARISG